MVRAAVGRNRARTLLLSRRFGFVVRCSRACYRRRRRRGRRFRRFPRRLWRIAAVRLLLLWLLTVRSHTRRSKMSPRRHFTPLRRRSHFGRDTVRHQVKNSYEFSRSRFPVFCRSRQSLFKRPPNYSFTRVVSLILLSYKTVPGFVE